MNNAQLSDDELVSQTRTGNGAALEELLRRYQPLIRSEAGRLYLRGGDHDDLLQEATIGLLKAIHSYDLDAPTGFPAFSQTCVRNQVTDALRRDSGKQASLLSDAVSLDDFGEVGKANVEPADPAAGRSFAKIEDRATYDSIRNALDEKLTPAQRQVLLAYAMGSSQRQISAEMGISVRQVRRLLTEAREALQHLI